VILLLAVPILIQVYFNAELSYWLNRKLGGAWCVAGPLALIGASGRCGGTRGIAAHNHFET
jgi:ACR3 family arsenite transporter